MAESGKHPDRSLFLHVRLLYACWIVTSVSCAYAIWLSFDQMSKMRLELENELSMYQRRVVEFNVHSDPWTNRVHAQPRTATTTTSSYATPVVIPSDDDVGEDFVRVRRNADKPRKKARKHRTRAADVSRPPTFFYGGRSTGENEGSGNTPEDWVWLTSYSRIPVSISI